MLLVTEVTPYLLDVPRFKIAPPSFESKVLVTQMVSSKTEPIMPASNLAKWEQREEKLINTFFAAHYCTKYLCVTL